MKDYTVRRYSFDELEGEGQAKAIKDMQERLSYWIQEDEITDYLRGYVEDTLGGYPDDIDIAYSLSYCQGDGVALYGRINKEDAPMLTWPEGVAYAHLVRNSYATHYSHYNTFSVELYDEEGEDMPENKVIEQQFRDLCRELERAGYKFIEGQLTEEAAISYIQDNYEDDYLLDGTLAYPVGIVEEVDA